MSTLSKTYDYGRGDCVHTLTYSVTTTATQVTVALTKVTFSGNINVNGLYLRVYLDGTAKISPAQDTFTWSGTSNTTFNKGTAATSKVLKLQVGYNSNGSSPLWSTTVNISVPALASYAITFNRGNLAAGNCSPSSITQGTKYQGQTYTIPSTVFTDTTKHLLFDHWLGSNGVNYVSGNTYTTDAALTLTAQYTQQYYDPIVAIDTSQTGRCTQAGVLTDDESTYYKVTASIKVDTRFTTFSNTATWQARTAASATALTQVSRNATSKGTSGNYTEYEVVAVYSGIAEASAGTFTLVTTQTHHSLTVTISKGVSVGNMLYALDVYRGATGVGIGTSASDGYFDVGYPTRIYNGLNIFATTDAQLPMITSSTSGIDSYIKCKHLVPNDSGAVVLTGFGVGSGGVNHGIWSYALNKWLIYANRDYGYLMSGVFRIGNNASPAPSFYQSYDYALLRANNSGSSWHPILSFRSAGGGSWSIGTYNNENLIFSYVQSGATDNTKSTQIAFAPPSLNASHTIPANSLAYKSSLSHGCSLQDTTVTPYKNNSAYAIPAREDVTITVPITTAAGKRLISVVAVKIGGTGSARFVSRGYDVDGFNVGGSNTIYTYWKNDYGDLANCTALTVTVQIMTISDTIS